MKQIQFLQFVTISLISFLFSTAVSAQEQKVKGVVRDETGAPLPGTTVMIKGTTTGVSTQMDGSYAIKAPDPGKEYVLGFYFMGMVTQEIRVSTQREINVVMKEDNKIQESVIIGAYGTKQTREDLVGSAFQVNSEALKDKPKTRIDNLLEGLVPGLTLEAANQGDAVTTRDRFNVRVRGDGSLSASREPLWVIDGVPMYTGSSTLTMPGMYYTVSPLTFMDPNDIESITVLKDADQTTIYGASGSNGVILVTTKSGRFKEPLKISVNVNYGVSVPDYSTRFKMMNASQYLEVAKEAWVNSGSSLKDFPYQDNDYNSYSTTDTDWAKEYLGIGSDLYTSLTLSHGSEKARTYLSASYYKNENIVKSDTQQRLYVRLNETFVPWKNAEVGISLGATYNNNDLFPLSKDYLEALPITSPYLEDGITYRLYNKIWSEDQQDFIMRKFFDNSIPERDLSDFTSKSVKTMFNGTFKWKPVKGLEFNANYGYNYLTNFEDYYYSRETLSGMGDEGVKLGSSRKGASSYPEWTTNETLRYTNDFGKHHLMAYVGTEFKSSGYKVLSASGRGFMNDHIRELEYVDKTTVTASSNIKTTRGESFFGRAEYSFDKRYYISANLRRDGHSAFGIYSRWSNFWSVGTSWNVHREKFFHVDWIDMLKFKASFGTSGNSNVDTSSSKGSYNYSASYSYMGIPGGTLGAVANPGLGWETMYTTNIGTNISIGKFLDIEIEAYNKMTKDLISSIYVSRVISESKVPTNVGRLRNRGIEMNLSSTNIKRPGFTWTTTFNISHNENRIIELYEGVPTSFGTTIWMENRDRNTFALVKWAGVDPTDGSPLWYDLNGNLTHTYNYGDRRFEKSSTPICYGGMVNSFKMGRFSASFQINYSIGGWDLATFAMNFFDDGYDIIGKNQAVEIYYDRWTTPGQGALYPKVQQTSNNSSTMSSTRYLYRKTYFNLSNISLGYDVPDKISHFLGLRSANLSLVGNNMYLFTPDQSRKFNSYKTVRNGYPVSRIISLNLTANF